MVRRKDLAKGKAELKGALKMRSNGSTEIFKVVKVTKQKSKGLGYASFLYQISSTNGDPVKGIYRREELLILPVMSGQWGPGVGIGYHPGVCIRFGCSVHGRYHQRRNRFPG